MNLVTALESISKSLAHLTFQVSQENLSGLFSKNKLTEDLFLPVFSRLFSAPDLHNLNTATFNHPHLDLASISSRVGIQVTTDGTAAKITETLHGFIGTQLNPSYDRLIIFLLRGSRPKFTSKTKSKWSNLAKNKLVFRPDADIIALPELFSLIQALPYQTVIEIRDILAKSVVGEEHVDVLGQLARINSAHLEYEKRTAKYIPGIFIETRSAKQLCRCFCHPVLFLERSIESVDRLNLQNWNRFMDRAGLPPLPLPSLSTSYPRSLLGAAATSVDASQAFTPLLGKLKEFKKDGFHPVENAAISAAKKAFLEENAHVLRNELQVEPYYIRERVDELKMPSMRIFMLTGRAGQGKTNLLCDLADNFLDKHNIPYAFLSGRELSVKHGPDLGQTICDHIFERTVKTMREAASLLSKEALRSNKPFVLMIDGLNEHRDIHHFSQQLEAVVDLIIQQPGIRCLFSCRSEFFDERFSNLVQGHLGSTMFVCKSAEDRLQEDERAELLTVYFDFFKVDKARVAEHVRESLTQDVLLLRFFCETYGARGKDADYIQPSINHVFREELFERYLNQKFHTAGTFLKATSDEIILPSSGRLFYRVLEVCVEHMVTAWEFTNVPISVVPAELTAALYSLLEEDLIIRRDASRSGEFADSVETINFTFDEFRDYVLAQYLVQRVFARSRDEFLAVLTKSDPEHSQPIEGLKRFLFYASRKNTNDLFHQFYRDQPWYTDVYHQEVFNLDTQDLTPGDAELVTATLHKNDYVALATAKRLAVRWDRDFSPILNLGLFLQYIDNNNDGEAYQLLVIDNFSSRRRQSGISVLSFCNLMTSLISELPAATVVSSNADLVRFLIYLLPVEATPMLNSPAYDVLADLVRRLPLMLIELLLNAANASFDQHKPFVWRLFHEASSIIPDPRILDVSKRYLLKADSLAPALVTEINRTVRNYPGDEVHAK